MTLKKLVERIWKFGGLSDNEFPNSPRFCLSGNPPYKYRNKEITHYDFNWITRGVHAELVLYTAPYYGAVYDEDLERVVRFRYTWNACRQEFRRTHG